jgi:hypothetical protein
MVLRRRLPTLRTQQQIECDDVRDHQQGHVDDRDCIGGTQLPRNRGKVELDGVVIVDNQVGHAHEIEGDDEELSVVRVFGTGGGLK